jgi:predicted RNA polymerase sigma factor
MPDPATDPVRQAVDDLYKSHYGKLVATLCSHYQDLPLETIEDIVQDSFAAALTAWSADTLPANPAGSIAWLHCTARSFAETDWRLISRLYLRLLRMNPNPFVELNYAIALYFAGTKTKAFEILHALLQQPFLHQYFLLNAALGKCYLLDGDLIRAREFLSRALDQTTQSREIDYIRQLLMRTS